MKDNVNHPEHYQTKSGLEVIDIIKAATEDLKGMEAVCTGNAIKYLCRWKKKNGLEDLKKAKWYLDRLITEFVIREGCDEVNETFKPNPVPPYTVNNKHKGLCGCGGEITSDGDSKCYTTDKKSFHIHCHELAEDEYEDFLKFLHSLDD